MSTQFINPVKTQDLDVNAAITAFIALNWTEGKAFEVVRSNFPYVIKGDSDPAKCLFPAGWYFAKHALRNKHHSTTGLYSEVCVEDSNGELWRTYAVEDARQVEGKNFPAPIAARVITAMNPGAKLVGLRHVMVKAGKPINVIDGWTVTGSTDMGFKLVSGDNTVKVFFI